MSDPEFHAEAVMQEVQAAFAPYRAQQGAAVDTLIAERRVEAWKETVLVRLDRATH